MNPTMLPEALAAKIAVDESGCWLPSGKPYPSGYVYVRYNGDRWRFHRLTYALLVGPIPDGLYTDHLCRNRRCCNPQHLEPVTPRENVRRSKQHITHCPLGHEYNAENTIWNKGTQRSCRTCATRRAREYKLRQKAALRNVDGGA